MLIVNADDWGRSVPETDAALSCATLGRVTSVTAMVFMRDSVRAAELAGQHHLNVGLHLNLDEAFSGDGIPPLLSASHRAVARFLGRFKAWSQLLYSPLLRQKLDYVYRAQYEEFVRLYGRPPTHVDGHRHRHLCANVVFSRIIPRGAKLRRGFSLWPGEKGCLNRWYRRWLDRYLQTRYVVTDRFYCLGQCLSDQRLDQVRRLAQELKVELMTHPLRPAEQAFLTSRRYLEIFGESPKGSYADL